MITDEKKKLIISEEFPIAAKYDPIWQLENEMGSPALWLIEGLTRKMDLKPKMKVLDLGCGNALTSIFLAKEFGVTVFATDLLVDPTQNQKRIEASGVADLVYPLQGDAHDLPYADEFFDAVVAVNSYQMFGTADNYFNGNLGKLVRRNAEIGMALFGIQNEFDDLVPEHLREKWWSEFYYFHSLDWWKRNLLRTGTVEIEFADDYDGLGNDIAQRWEVIPDRITLVRSDMEKMLKWWRIVLRKKQKPYN